MNSSLNNLRFIINELISEALDPVGVYDGDVDNDGEKNTRRDKYIEKRRKAIADSMKGRKKGQKSK